MERKISFETGEFYHVFNRGVDKREIFQTTADYERFLSLLYIANDSSPIRLSSVMRSKKMNDVLEMQRSDPLVSIGAYCLMPNHYHLLITQCQERGISRFLLKLQTAYSMFFNIKNERSGALFQGVFKAQHVDSDTYFQYLYAYIHLNPASLVTGKSIDRALPRGSQIEKFVKNYPYSSYGAYIGNSHVITDPRPFPTEFVSAKTFSEMHDSWFRYRQERETDL